MVKIDYEKNLNPNVIMFSDYNIVCRKESDLKVCEIDFKPKYHFIFGMDLEISDFVKNTDKKYISLDCKCLKISIKNNFSNILLNFTV